jgi:hypothetical protein
MASAAGVDPVADATHKDDDTPTESPQLWRNKLTSRRQVWKAPPPAEATPDAEAVDSYMIDSIVSHMGVSHSVAASAWTLAKSTAELQLNSPDPRMRQLHNIAALVRPE